MSALSRYLRKHEHPYRLRRKNGKGVMEILFTDGYVTIRNRQPGTSKFIQEIHIAHSTWFSLIKSPQLMAATDAMEGPDFDRYLAERQYHREEALYLAEFRAQKSERRGKRRRRKAPLPSSRLGQA